LRLSSSKAVQKACMTWMRSTVLGGWVKCSLHAPLLQHQSGTNSEACMMGQTCCIASIASSLARTEARRCLQPLPAAQAGVLCCRSSGSSCSEPRRQAACCVSSLHMHPLHRPFIACGCCLPVVHMFAPVSDWLEFVWTCVSCAACAGRRALYGLHYVVRGMV
jgi:hypothetical protein